MMTSLTSSLAVDLSTLRAPAPPRREGSTSFADDLSSASDAIARGAPSPSPSPAPATPDRCGAPTPADQCAQQRAEQRDERRDERHDARDEQRDEQREERRDLGRAERRDERRDERQDERDERRDARRAGRRDDRRDDRRAAMDRARAARAQGKPQADGEAAATGDAAAKGDAAATGERIADALHDVRASEAKTVPLDPTPALPSTAEFAARADAAAAPEARHAHTLDALRQHLAAARGGDAQARDGEANVEAVQAQTTDPDAAATARVHDARASARGARAAASEGSPASDTTSAPSDATAATDDAAAVARTDAATTTMLDAAMHATPRGEAQPRVRGAARGIAEGIESASSRRVDADAKTLSAETNRAAIDASTHTDASAPAWRDAFSMPAPPASIGAAPAASIGAGNAAAGSAVASASSSVAEQTIAAAPGSAEFTRALSSQVTLWARDGTQEARLQLNPAELGPVTVFIAIDGAQARVDFHAHAAATRDAIEASLPSLAGALGEQGLELSGGGVFDRSGREASAQGQQGQAQTRPSTSAARDGGHDVDVGVRGMGTMTRTGTPRGLVDLVA